MTMTEIQEKWLSALESGDYKQGKYTLRDNYNCYCCLGVACDIYDKDGWEVDEDGEYFYQNGERKLYSGLDCEERTKVSLMNIFGLTNKQHDELVRLNDSLDYDFPAIAKYIRENIYV